MYDVTYTRALLAQSYWNYLKEVIQFHVTKVGKLHSRFSFVFIKKGGMDTYYNLNSIPASFFLNKIKFGYIRSMYIYKIPSFPDYAFEWICRLLKNCMKL